MWSGLHSSILEGIKSLVMLNIMPHHIYWQSSCLFLFMPCVSDATGVIVFARSVSVSVCVSCSHGWTDRHMDLNCGMEGKWKNIYVKFVGQGHRSKVTRSNNVFCLDESLNPPWHQSSRSGNFRVLDLGILTQSRSLVSFWWILMKMTSQTIGRKKLPLESSWNSVNRQTLNLFWSKAVRVAGTYNRQYMHILHPCKKWKLDKCPRHGKH